MGWQKVKTCSQISSGTCDKCKEETFYEAYRNDPELLCCGCYEITYEPQRAAERRAAIEQSRLDRERDLALALEGKLPGAIVKENGTVLGPVQTILGLPYRQVLREGLIDNIQYVPPMEESSVKNIYTSYLKSIEKKEEALSEPEDET